MSEEGFLTTRRTLLGTAAAGGLILAGRGSSDSGDSSSSSSSSSSGAPASGAQKQGGTMKFAPVELSRVTTPDPQSISTGYSLSRSMFSSLTRRDPAFKLENLLAEEFVPEGNDQSVWTVRVPAGVEFHNGKTLTADDVIFTIRRILDPKNPATAAVLMDAVDPKQLKKMDDRTVRLTLKYPNSQLPDAFRMPDTGIVPTDFDPKNPIGTGPFKQVSFKPSQRWVGERNPNY